MADSKHSEKTNWWVSVDLTTIFVVCVLGIGMYWAKMEYDARAEGERRAAEKIRLEKEEKEQRLAEKIAQEELLRKERLEQSKKEIAEKQAEVLRLRAAVLNPPETPPVEPAKTPEASPAPIAAPQPRAGGLDGDNIDVLRDRGLQLLKESEANPDAIVDAARALASAALLYEKKGDETQAVDTNGFLYWCKKKMTLVQLQALSQKDSNGAALATRLLISVDPVPNSKAAVYLMRADAFANAHADEHLLNAIRYFEVAERFRGTDISLQAQDKSLKEMQLAASAPKTPATPAPAKATDARPTMESLVEERASVQKNADTLIEQPYQEYIHTFEDVTRKIQGQEPAMRAASMVASRDPFGHTTQRFDQNAYNKQYASVVNQFRPILDLAWKKVEVKREVFIAPYRAVARDTPTPEAKRRLQFALEVYEQQYKKKH